MLLKVTLSDDELAGVDRHRGQIPRATWIRELVRSAIAGDEYVVEAAMRVAPQRDAAGLRPAAGHREGCGCHKCDEARA